MTMELPSCVIHGRVNTSFCRLVLHFLVPCLILVHLLISMIVQVLP